MHFEVVENQEHLAIGVLGQAHFREDRVGIEDDLRLGEGIGGPGGGEDAGQEIEVGEGEVDTLGPAVPD